MKKALPSGKLITMLLVFLSINASIFAANEPIPTGSFIINMGVTPQTYANGIKPWGMVHDLIKNYKVQVKWVINPVKTKDGIDFTYNGTDFKGGTFIIPKKYRSATVDARIAYWQSQGVVGITTTSDFNADVTYNLKYSPRWTFDFQNGNIALGFLDEAGIPNAEYPKKYPSELNSCDDIFVMPHADPTWATHSNLLTWNLTNKGWIWAGCHAVSVLENLANPSNAAENMKFLSQTGLVPFGSHSDGTPPYSYRFPTDPEMQFMGTTDAAQQNGSEQIFLPQTNTWRASTKVAVYDSTQQNVPSLSPGEAGAIVYGRAFGDTSRGKVMYTGGHNINKGNADAVAAMRTFFNFSFLSVYDKAINPTIIGPINLTSLNTYTYRASLPVGSNSNNYSFRWTSSCGGTFSNPFDTVTLFTAPTVSSCSNCIVYCEIADGCGRQYYQAFDVVICPGVPPVALDRTAKMILNPDGTGPQKITEPVPCAGTDEDGFVVNYVLKTLPANGVLFYDNDNNPATADVAITTLPTGELVLTPEQMKSMKFDPANGFGGNASFTYTVTDNSTLRDLTPATYTIPVNPPPVAINKICTPVASNAGASNVCAMQATDNGTIVSYTITSLPPINQCKVFVNDVDALVGQVLSPAEANAITFKPNGKYVGYSEIMYTATDNNGATDITPATLTLQMVNQPPATFDVAANNIANPTGSTQYNMPALSAIDGDGAVASYSIISVPPVTQGQLYYSAGGTYTPANNNQLLTLSQANTLKYDPNESFSGMSYVLYAAKDSMGLTDNTPDTLSIPVNYAIPAPNPQVLNHWYAGGGWQDVPPLSGSGTPTGFIITYVPPTTQGKLGPDLNADGKGDFRIGLDAGKELPYTLTAAEAANLMFDPEKSFTGNSYFTFQAKNTNGTNPADAAVQFIDIYNTIPQTYNVVNSIALSHTALATVIDNISAFDAEWAIKPQDKNKEFIVFNTVPAPSTGVLKTGTMAIKQWDVINITQADAMTFDPAADNSDTAVFSYSYMDKCLDIDPTPATFKIPIIGPANIAPVSVDTSMAPISIIPVANACLALNGTDVDGTIVSFRIQTITSPWDGTLYLDGNALTNNSIVPYEKRSQLYFIPSGNNSGTTFFKYKSVDNGGLESNIVYQYIPIVNIAPVATNISIAALKKNTTVPIIGLNASDADGTISTYTILTLPALNTLQCDLNGTAVYSNVAANQVLTPAQASRLRMITGNIVGSYTFTYRATDNAAAISNTANYTFTIATAAALQAPFANKVITSPIAMSAGQTLISPVSATDLDGTITGYTILSIPPDFYGRLYYNNGGIYDSITAGNKPITLAQAVSLKFRSAGLFAGNVVFTFIATDNDNLASNIANYTIPVTNTDPVSTPISNAAISSNSGPAFITALAATDDGTIASFVITDLPDASQGTLVLDGTPVTTNQVIPLLYANRLEFDPNPAFMGTASFNFTAIDNNGAKDKTPASFTIPVVNFAPVADDKNSQVITNTIGTAAKAIPALSGTDNDGSIVSYKILSLPANGVLYMNAVAATVNQVLTPAQAAMLSFDPVDNFNSSTSFTYSVTDNSSNNSATAFYTIVANVPPTTNNKISSPFTPTTPRTSIPALVGWDDVSVAFYTVLTLPAATAGKLYLNNVEVTSLSQVSNLTTAQISQFSFQPASTFAGAIFTYTATDNLGIIDVTPAVYIIPQSPFGNNTPLPIDLMTFSGKALVLDNVLNWSTSQEVNSKQIEIERSSNGIDFARIGIVAAKGNSSLRSDYSYTDKYVPGGVLYYRLKLVDIDGQFKYSNIIVIKRDIYPLVINKVMPNPFNDKVEIELLAVNSNTSTLNMYNMVGSVVKTLQFKTSKGINRIQVNDLGSLGSGTYILTISNDDGQVKTKLVKISN